MRIFASAQRPPAVDAVGAAGHVAALQQVVHQVDHFALARRYSLRANDRVILSSAALLAA